MNIIDVKYICETDGYKIYRIDNNDFIKTVSFISLEPTNPEVGVFEYGTYNTVTDKYQTTY
jgi:hypothetical protein|tara:strand:- start:4460 stop:4642 length:183 start_codon:yes stop_codon:yes gene_type:complete